MFVENRYFFGNTSGGTRLAPLYFVMIISMLTGHFINFSVNKPTFCDRSHGRKLLYRVFHTFPNIWSCGLNGHEMLKNIVFRKNTCFLLKFTNEFCRKTIFTFFAKKLICILAGRFGGVFSEIKQHNMSFTNAVSQFFNFLNLRKCFGFCSKKHYFLQKNQKSNFFETFWIKKSKPAY